MLLIWGEFSCKIVLEAIDKIVIHLVLGLPNTLHDSLVVALACGHMIIECSIVFVVTTTAGLRRFLHACDVFFDSLLEVCCSLLHL